MKVSKLSKVGIACLLAASTVQVVPAYAKEVGVRGFTGITNEEGNFTSLSYETIDDAAYKSTIDIKVNGKGIVGYEDSFHQILNHPTFACGTGEISFKVKAEQGYKISGLSSTVGGLTKKGNVDQFVSIKYTNDAHTEAIVTVSHRAAHVGVGWIIYDHETHFHGRNDRVLDIDTTVNIVPTTSYSVTFKGINGESLGESIAVNPGDTVPVDKAVAESTKDYTFTNTWFVDGRILTTEELKAYKIYSDTVIQAVYTEKNVNYTVETVMLDEYGKEESSSGSETMTGLAGEDVTLTPETKNGYVLLKDESVLGATLTNEKAIVLKQVYARDINGNGIADKDEEKHTVKFVHHGTVIKEEMVFAGKSATAPEIQHDIDKEKLMFVGWDQSFERVTEDLVVNAVCKKVVDASVIEPSTPVEPEQPEQPELPEEPETPVLPETPEQPEEPETPVLPETPELPEEPETPVLPPVVEEEEPVLPPLVETPKVEEESNTETPVVEDNVVAVVTPEQQNNNVENNTNETLGTETPVTNNNQPQEETEEMEEEETPLAGEENNDNNDSEIIEDEETALAGKEEMNMNWLWLVVVAIIAAITGKKYVDRKKA